MSQPLTFPCPFCGRRMGVGVDLAGRHVRCPHCRQIVLAPALAAPQVPVPASVPPDPIFQPPSREGPDSILGDPDESEDEVFSSSKDVNRPRIPNEVSNPWGANQDGPTRIEHRTDPDTPPVQVPESENPLSAAPPPPVRPTPATPKTGSVVISNPWAGLDEMVANPPPPPPPPPVVVTAPPAAEAPAPAEAVRRPPEASGGIPKGAFFALAGYALVVTVLAVYALFIKSGEKIDPGHPLSTIPDNFGEFDPAQRKKVTKLAVPIDGELPPELRVALGKKLTIGQLEIEPKRVAVRPLAVFGEGKAGHRETMSTSKLPALVLTLRVRNTSDSVAVFPLDPAFNRKANPSLPTPATGLVVGEKTFWGGEIDWPFNATFVKRIYEREQETDATPLKPKESREYVVFTAANGQAVEAAKTATGPLTWRVQVRRGLIDFRGKDVPVTAIVGVEFQKSDVSGL